MMMFLWYPGADAAGTTEGVVPLGLSRHHPHRSCVWMVVLVATAQAQILGQVSNLTMSSSAKSGVLLMKNRQFRQGLQPAALYSTWILTQDRRLGGRPGVFGEDTLMTKNLPGEPGSPAIVPGAFAAVACSSYVRSDDH